MFKYITPGVHLAKLSDGRQQLLDALDSFINQNEAEPIRILCRLWKDQATVLTYPEIRQWIDTGQIDQSFIDQWRQDYSKALTEAFAGLWLTAASEGFKASAPFQWLSDTDFVYKPQASGMAQWVTNHTAELVTHVTSTQEQAIKDVCAMAIRDHISSSEMQYTIRPIVGLTGVQAKANAKYYTTVKEQLLKDHPRMKVENAEKKARHKAQMYAEKQQRYRAQTIARTELGNAYNQGAYDGVQDAISRGYINPPKKRWVTARGPHVCQHCESLEGKIVEFNESFDGGQFGLVDGPLLHPRCQCVLEFLKGDNTEDVGIQGFDSI